MNKMLLADIDGVLADLCVALESRWGKPEHPDEYSMRIAYPGLSASEICETFNDPEFYRYMQPVHLSLSALWTLHNLGWDVSYVTSRPKHIGEVTREWLPRHRYPSDGDLFVLGKDIDKADWIVLNYPQAAVVEDHGPTAGKLSRLGMRAFVLSVHRDWPYGIAGAAPAPVFESWRDIVTYLLTTEEVKCSESSST